VRLTLSDAAAARLAVDPFTYVEGTLDMLGQTLVVGVRIKGSSTLESLSDKPSLKVKLDEIVPGQAILGVEAFNLHNSALDPSMMAEVLAYGMYRDAGLPAPSTGYATVDLQVGSSPAEYRGLYVIVEQKNSEFLDQWYTSDEGGLYEAGTDNWPCDLDDPGLCG
jgi:spore coat protein CotH